MAVERTLKDTHPRPHCPTNTRHHTTDHPHICSNTHTRVIIYGCAQASDGTRQGSSPPRRVLCVSCGEANSLLRSQPASREQCARHGPREGAHALRPPRCAHSGWRSKQNPPSLSGGALARHWVAKRGPKSSKKNPTRQTTELLSKVAKQHFPHVSVMHTVGTHDREAGPRWGPAAWPQTTT